MSPAQAALHPPVRVRGTVTLIANQPAILFVQDGSGGVCVFGPRDVAVRRLLKPGVVVEVEGVVQPGRPTPYIGPRGKELLGITVLATARPPAAGKATLPELAGSTARHGELVEVTGVVRGVRAEGGAGAGGQQDATVVTLAAEGARVEAAYLGPAANLPTDQWVGATVRARGVFNSSHPDKPHPALNRLLVFLPRDLAVEAPAVPREKLPVTPVAEVDDAVAAAAASPTDPTSPPPPASPARVRVQATVTLALPGKGLYVQDGPAALWVDAPPPPAVPPASAAASQPATAPVPRPGDRVDLVGFTARRPGGGVVLEDAAWRVSGSGTLPEAARITADQALGGSFHARLVSLDAVVLEVSRLSEGPTLVLQAGERVFLARLPDGGPDAQPGVKENSWVTVTGVCVNNRLPGDPGPAAAARPVSFHLMLADPKGIAVIRAPNWWTLEKVLIGTGVMLAAALAALAWVVALRRRVNEQTAVIRRHVHQETVHEERIRIARELHDSLEQDLLGITMQLKATEKLLDRPERARDSLSLASAMVRRSQAETHRAVWDLRERKPGQEGLVPTLRQAVAGLTTGVGGGAPAVEVRVEGAERELPPQTENHLLRVALEAVTNAFKHAAARTVVVAVRYADHRVELTVTDDGKGFDAAHPPPPISGHFGLFGMGERAQKLHGELTVKSQPGRGTEIRLVAPVGTNGNGKS